jgi:hypothetical protein
LTAAVTERMKIPSAIRNDSVLSCPATMRARRFSVTGRESTGGHSSGCSRPAFVPSGERTGLFPNTYVTKDGVPFLRGQNASMFTAFTAPFNVPTVEEGHGDENSER